MRTMLQPSTENGVSLPFAYVVIVLGTCSFLVGRSMNISVVVSESCEE